MLFNCSRTFLKQHQQQTTKSLVKTLVLSVQQQQQTIYRFSTATSTQLYRDRISSNTIDSIKLPKNQWSVSRLGLNVDDLNLIESEQKATLISAFKNGCNLIHSYNNDSKSPTDVLSSIVGVSDVDTTDKQSNVIIKRSELIYMQRSRPLPPSQSLSDQADIRRFIVDQVSCSLERLSTRQLDVFLLDISSCILMSTSFEQTRQQIQTSMVALEEMVASGKLQSYGLSLNNLAPTAGETIELLESILQFQSPHFQFLEFPFNICQHETFSMNNYSVNTQSLIEFAKQHQLTTINSSPSYFTNPVTGKLSRFANVRSHKDQDLHKLLKEAFDLAIHLEIINPIFKDSVQAEMIKRTPDIIGQLRWAHLLVYDAQKHEKLSNYWSWRRLLSSKIRPQVNEAVMSIFSNHIMNSWGAGYRKAINNLFDLYSNSLEASIFDQQEQLANQLYKSLEIPIASTSTTTTNTDLLKLSQQISATAGIDLTIETLTNTDELKSIFNQPNNKQINLTTNQLCNSINSINWKY
ncbi:hypothetical protein PPL_03138 [Heterostelium album PN500]|uniref:NADP-dependent oxidoreductase domain-containing protein n=1 Tax=Heterostelium pallidum (strain ATCC 26659 / Pp 5 / PN500) TaxID=670386 RepID=D3B417_HETP5|nr:hypothetical protein PPL_03138 [Heterostelium album PN500]EFA84065.1 hypothetical protein PPL_03138 [Heterostelium album PN500]|eukprot:XP_020436182.1 hypothetical protein PPL_03138 [Heterostelium album PN500]